MHPELAYRVALARQREVLAAAHVKAETPLQPVHAGVSVRMRHRAGWALVAVGLRLAVAPREELAARV